MPVGDSELLTKLRNHLHNQYPDEVSAIFKSLPHQALEVLRGFFQDVFPPRELDGQEFRDQVTTASYVNRVLRALGCATSERISTDPSTAHGGAIKKGKKPQMQTKRTTKLSTPENVVDMDAFRALNLRVPSSEIEVSRIAKDLKFIHKRVLTVRKPPIGVATL